MTATTFTPQIGVGIYPVSSEETVEDYEALRWASAVEEWTDWMIAAGSRPGTVALRRYQIRRLAEAHLRRSPWRVSTADLIGWLAAQPWDAETRKSYRSALRSFYAWAVRAGHTRHNPAAALPVVRVAQTVARPAPDEVVAAALEHATDRDRLIVALAAYAGLRRAEIAALRWDDIGADMIRVRGKGGRVRVVPLHQMLAGELGKERLRRDEGGRGTGYRYGDTDGAWVFPGQVSGHMTPGAVGKAAGRVLGGWGVHTLRHRFATRVHDATHDLLTVQELLGHSKPETTARYVRRDADALRRAVDAV